jgi:hypothetical protein
MDRNAGIERNGPDMVEALAEMREMARENRHNLTISNMIAAARIITAAALNRKESRGGHYRQDFPQERPELARRSFYRLADIECMAARFAAGEIDDESDDAGKGAGGARGEKRSARKGGKGGRGGRGGNRGKRSKAAASDGRSRAVKKRRRAVAAKQSG